MQFSKQSAVLASVTALVMALVPISAASQDTDEYNPNGACIIKSVGKMCSYQTRQWCDSYETVFISTSFFEGYTCEEAKAAGYY